MRHRTLLPLRLKDCPSSNDPFRLRENCRYSRLRAAGFQTVDCGPDGAGAPESLAGKFRTFGSGLVALRRQSPVAIFQFPFRYTRDRLDM
jgi:hypothetical protein